MPIVAMLAAVGLWGPSFVITKFTLQEIPPLTTAFLRFFLASCFLYPLWRHSSERLTFNRDSRRQLFLGGFVGVTAYFVLENLGIHFTTAGDAALLMAAIPVFCLLTEAMWFKQAIPWRRSLGVIASIIGVFLVIGQAPSIGGKEQLLGDVLVIAAALCWAAYSLLGRSLNRLPKLTVVAHQTLYGTLMLAPAAFLEFAQWRGFSLSTGLCIVYLGIICSAVTYLLYNYALKTLAASQVSVFLNLVPIIGVIAAAFFLGEQISVMQILGGGIIISGVVFSTRG